MTGTLVYWPRSLTPSRPQWSFSSHLTYTTFPTLQYMRFGQSITVEGQELVQAGKGLYKMEPVSRVAVTAGQSGVRRGQMGRQVIESVDREVEAGQTVGRDGLNTPELGWTLDILAYAKLFIFQDRDGTTVQGTVTSA